MFYDIFMALCEERGIAASRALMDIEMGRSAITVWRKGGEPSNSTKRKIADYFGTTVGEMMSKETKKPLVNEDEELTEYLEMLKTREECRMLFSVAKGATKEDVERAVKIIEALRKG